MWNPVPAGSGSGTPRHRRVIEVDQAPAALADEMVMPSRHGIESHHRVRVVDLLGQACPDEGLEHPVNGRARETRQTPLDGVEDLVRGRVVPPSGQLLEHRAALNGQCEPSAPTLLLEIGDAILLGCVGHCLVHYTKRKSVSISTAWALALQSTLSSGPRGERRQVPHVH